MNNRTFLTSLSFVGLLSALLANAAEDKAERFSIISIVTDDQALWTIGAYGNAERLRRHVRLFAELRGVSHQIRCDQRIPREIDLPCISFRNHAFDDGVPNMQTSSQ